MSKWTKVLKASIDNNKCNNVIDLMKDNNIDVDEASPNFVAEFASGYGYELTSEEVVYISDNYVKGYGVEYRNMHTAIHHVIVTDTKEKAEQILNLLNKLHNVSDEAKKDEIQIDSELQILWEDINNLQTNSFEINDRNIDDNGIYNGIKIINYDGNIPDIWE